MEEVLATSRELSTSALLAPWVAAVLLKVHGHALCPVVPQPEPHVQDWGLRVTAGAALPDGRVQELGGPDPLKLVEARETLAMFDRSWLYLSQLQPPAEESRALYDCMLISSYEELAEYSVTTFPVNIGVRQVCDFFVYEYLLQRTFRRNNWLVQTSTRCKGGFWI